MRCNACIATETHVHVRFCSPASESVAGFTEGDHQQMLQALAYHGSGEITSVSDERGNDLRRIRQKAQDVAHGPEELSVLIIIEHAAVPSISTSGIADSQRDARS
jgi:hypothetical protein